MNTISHVVGDQRAVIAFLSDKATYGAETVNICETHGAVVFLVGDRAYKLKRAVKFPYMDYSTPTLRKAMCEREFAINRQLAPDLYLGVMAVVADGDGFRLAGASESGAVDWVVVMRHFAQQDLLKNRVRQGSHGTGLIRRVADEIAGFHVRAERMATFGGAAEMRAIVDGNQTMLRECGAAFDSSLVDRYADLSEQRLRQLRALLGARRRNGLVRRCHGDLHLENIFVQEDRPVLFDAIEFDDRLACVDVLYDLAFLLMDLDSFGLRAEANALLNAYLEKTADFAGLAALPLFLSCRAAIRAHVRVAAGPSDRHKRDASPQKLLAMAVDYLEPPAPVLVAIGGLSGTGKSTLAHALAPGLGAAPGAVILRSDAIRKAMFAVPQTERLPDDAYSQALGEEVYAEMRRNAWSVVHAGHAAIADAVFGIAEERSAIEAAARAAGVPFAGLWLTAERQVCEERLTSRRNDASDATVRVLHRQMEHIIPPTHWTVVDAAGDPAAVLARARAAIAAHATGERPQSSRIE